MHIENNSFSHWHWYFLHQDIKIESYLDCKVFNDTYYGTKPQCDFHTIEPFGALESSIIISKKKCSLPNENNSNSFSHWKNLQDVIIESYLLTVKSLIMHIMVIEHVPCIFKAKAMVLLTVLWPKTLGYHHGGKFFAISGDTG